MNVPDIERREHYLNINYGIRSWLLTTDHKRIAWLYLLSVTLFFFIGGIFATLIRLELLTPQGDLVQSETYNKLFTMHGVTMIFFFLIPSIPAVLGNFLVPMMIGARDLAFPRLNLASWYIFILGGAFTLTAAAAGGVDTDGLSYPYSSIYSNTHVVLTVVGVFITGFLRFSPDSTSLSRSTKCAPRMTWFRLPLSSGLTTPPALFFFFFRQSSPSLWCWWHSNGFFTWESSIPRWEEIRCCFSIYFGSTRIPRSIS